MPKTKNVTEGTGVVKGKGDACHLLSVNKEKSLELNVLFYCLLERAEIRVWLSWAFLFPQQQLNYTLRGLHRIYKV